MSNSDSSKPSCELFDESIKYHIYLVESLSKIL